MDMIIINHRDRREHGAAVGRNQMRVASDSGKLLV